MAGYPYYISQNMNPYYNPYAYGAVGAYNYQVAPQVPQPTAQAQTQMQSNEDFKWVKSEKEVEDWYVEPNRAIAFWHSEEPVLYLKQADTTGKPTIRTFDLVERVPASKADDKEESPKIDYVTKEDFASVITQMTDALGHFKKEVEALKEATGDIEQMKKDMYGIAGKKKTVRKADEEDA